MKRVHRFNQGIQMHSLSFLKIDPKLLQKLSLANGDELVCVIMSLDTETTSPTKSGKKPCAREFTSQVEYRRAMLYHHGGLLEEVNPVSQSLRELGLLVHSYLLGKIIVVEGTVDMIISALDIPGVKYAAAG